MEESSRRNNGTIEEQPKKGAREVSLSGAETSTEESGPGVGVRRRKRLRIEGSVPATSRKNDSGVKCGDVYN